MTRRVVVRLTLNEAEELRYAAGKPDPRGSRRVPEARRRETCASGILRLQETGRGHACGRGAREAGVSAFYNERDPFAAAWLRELMAAGHIAPGVVDERPIQEVTPADVHAAGRK